MTLSNTSCTAQGGSGGVLDHLTDTGSRAEEIVTRVPEDAAPVASHTPTPWMQVGLHPECILGKGQFANHSFSIAPDPMFSRYYPDAAQSLCEANAALIVEAVNSYASSQERIRELESEVRQLRIDNARLRDENICAALSRKDAL